MIQKDEHIQTLTELGLTFLQAKTYFALAKLGRADVKTISKVSRVARPDIYRIMPLLQKRGLVEKILTSPTLYKVTPINESLNILLQNKTQECIKLQMKIKNFLNNLQYNNDETAPHEEEQQFSIISSKRLLHKKLSEKDRTAQKNIDAIANWQVLRTTFFNRSQDIKNALQRGVKFRIITETHEKDKYVQKIIKTFQQSSLFEIRYNSAPIPINTVIHDNAEINMCIAVSPTEEVPSLSSTNPRFLKVITAYFEELWNKVIDAQEAAALKSAESLCSQDTNS